MLERIKIAYFLYLLIGCVVSIIIGGKPVTPIDPYDDSLPKRLGVAIWWPFVLLLLFIKWREKKD